MSQYQNLQIVIGLEMLNGRPKKRNGPVVTPEQSLEHRLRFEKLLFDLSARFLATPVDQVDIEIDQALKRLLEFFQVDRCSLLEFRKDEAFARISHAAFGEGLEPISGEINLAEQFPWCYEQLKQGEPINISRLEDYPEEALKDRQSQAALGIKSALIIPVAVGGRISRTIVINHTREHQTWPEDYIPRLRLLGEIFVNALERRESRLQLEERLGFETLLSEISATLCQPARRPDGQRDSIRPASHLRTPRYRSLHTLASPGGRARNTAADSSPSTSGKRATPGTDECLGFCPLGGAAGPGRRDGHYFEPGRPPA